MLRKIGDFFTNLVFPTLSVYDIVVLFSLLMTMTIYRLPNLYNQILYLIESSPSPGFVVIVLIGSFFILFFIPLYLTLSIILMKNASNLNRSILVIYFYLYSLIIFSVSAFHTFINDNATFFSINSIVVLILFIRSVSYLTVLRLITDFSEGINLSERFYIAKYSFYELALYVVLSVVFYYYFVSKNDIFSSIALAYFSSTALVQLKDSLHDFMS